MLSNPMYPPWHILSGYAQNVILEGVAIVKR
jgi:hypothetical protein